ncbi:MAG: prepilin peptidase, partial [Sedimentisphaerales bacterium]|nr:prepilin peptidase [Sedimentisphaerales bacterium]
ALGAIGGLALSLLFVRLGWVKRSFTEVIEAENRARQKNQPVPDVPVNIRKEMVREMAFLAPVVVMGLLWMAILTGPNRWAAAWSGLLAQQKWIAGLLGSVYGFMIGGAVVWATRILGSLAFGREAMGLGDVHLMAAVGAILGWISPVIAFFLAPFLALGWALARWALHRTREIPYGPFLAAATLIVMIGYDPIVDYFRQALTGPAALP